MRPESAARTLETNGSGVSRTCGADGPLRPPPSSSCLADSHSGSPLSRPRAFITFPAKHVAHFAFERLLDDQPQRQPHQIAPASRRPRSPLIKARSSSRVRAGADNSPSGCSLRANGANRKPASCRDSARAHPNEFPANLSLHQRIFGAVGEKTHMVDRLYMGHISSFG